MKRNLTGTYFPGAVLYCHQFFLLSPDPSNLHNFRVQVLIHFHFSLFTFHFIRHRHFFRFAEQGGVDCCFTTGGAAEAVVVDPVLAEFGLEHILGAAPVDLFQLALRVADVGGIQ